MLEPNIVYDIAKKLNNNERNIRVLMRSCEWLLPLICLRI